MRVGTHAEDSVATLQLQKYLMFQIPSYIMLIRKESKSETFKNEKKQTTIGLNS